MFWFGLCGIMLLGASLAYVKIEMKGGVGKKGEEKLEGRQLQALQVICLYFYILCMGKNMTS